MNVTHITDTVPRGGELSTEQAAELCRWVSGRHVHDLGAGSVRLALQLLALGAQHVTAVDHTPRMDKPHHGLTYIRAWFHEYSAKLDVAFVSWPIPLYLFPPMPTDAIVINGLTRLCDAAPMVCYLGSNFGGNWCGNLELWRSLGTREVLAHAPDERNTLIVYGPRRSRIPGQSLLPEEKAALYREFNPRPVYGVTYGM